jgi:hypothetical protein
MGARLPEASAGPKQGYLRRARQSSIAFFIDMWQARAIPSTSPLQARDRSKISRPNNGVFTLVGGTYTVRTLIELAIRLFHFDSAKLFETEGEAWTCLHQAIAQEDPYGTPLKLACKRSGPICAIRANNDSNKRGLWLVIGTIIIWPG